MSIVQAINKQMTALARLKFVILGWAGASVFFTAVLEISELGHKLLGFALYSNAVHFALWALALPVFTWCIRRFPLKDPKRIRNAGIRLILIAAFAMLVAFTHWAIVFPTYFPYRSSFPTFSILLRSELFRFLPTETLIGLVIVTAIEAWQVLQDLQAERMRAMDLERPLAGPKLSSAWAFTLAFLRTTSRPFPYRLAPCGNTLPGGAGGSLYRSRKLARARPSGRSGSNCWRPPAAGRSTWC